MFTNIQNKKYTYDKNTINIVSTHLRYKVLLSPLNDSFRNTRRNN